MGFAHYKLENAIVEGIRLLQVGRAIGERIRLLQLSYWSFEE
jgi:hypothetical protein